jgi:choline dehydrogenase-like flavoprotein
VDRISWAETNGSKVLAEGVEYTTEDGKAKTLYAEKEVIVSAGAVRTPAILELSGVGNPEYAHSDTLLPYLVLTSN